MTKRELLKAQSKSAAFEMTKRFQEVDRLGQQQIELDLIDPDPSQPRKDFDEIEMQELQGSIERRGVLQPIVLEKIGERFRIIAGERRWRASKNLNRNMINAFVLGNLSDADRLDVQMVENLTRENLNTLERVEGILRLIAHRSGQTRDAVLEDWRKRYSDTSVRTEISSICDIVLAEFSLALTTVYRQHTKIEKMDPQILAAIRKNQVSFTIGALVDSLKDQTQRHVLLEECISKKLSKQVVEQRLKSAQSKTLAAKNPEWKKRFRELQNMFVKGSPETQSWLDQKLKEIERDFKKRLNK